MKLHLWPLNMQRNARGAPFNASLVRGSLGEGGNALTLQPRSPIREIRVIRSSPPLCPFVFIRG